MHFYVTFKKLLYEYDENLCIIIRNIIIITRLKFFNLAINNKPDFLQR